MLFTFVGGVPLNVNGWNDLGNGGFSAQSDALLRNLYLVFVSELAEPGVAGGGLHVPAKHFARHHKERPAPGRWITAAPRISRPTAVPFLRCRVISQQR
jgi:hypothetical protein